MENYIKLLILNYNAHLSQNVPLILDNHGKVSLKNDKIKLSGDQGHLTHDSGLHAINSRVKTIVNLFIIINKLLDNHAKILVINGTGAEFKIDLSKIFDEKINKLTGHIRSKRNTIFFQNSYNKPYLLQSGWIDGTITNWSNLCKVAWNSQKLLELASRVDKNMYLEPWVLETESCFKGLKSADVKKTVTLPEIGSTSTISKSSKSSKSNNFSLAYKQKADCIVLINPNTSCLRECEKLNIPLCVLSHTFVSRATGSHLFGSKESCFLTYLILCVIYNLT